MLSFRYSGYELRGSDRPDVLFPVQPSLAGALDAQNLDRMGHLDVPSFVDGVHTFNAAIGPVVQRYGYVDDAGMRQGGGAVGAHPLINDQAFRRRSIEFALDHELH